MTAQISPQMRIVALAGVLLIVLAGGGLMLMRHRSQPGTVVVPPAQHVSTPSKSPSHPSPAATAKQRVVKIVRPAVDPVLPAKLRAALERQRVVLVATFDPQVKVDSLAVAEARAGAAAAHAGFVTVSLLDDAVAGRLTATMPAGELLPSPGILVYKRPGTVVFRYDGYLDRAAVAQAIAVSK